MVVYNIYLDVFFSVLQDSTMAVKLQKAEEEMRIEKQKLKERVLQIESMMGAADAEVHTYRCIHTLIQIYSYTYIITYSHAHIMTVRRRGRFTPPFKRSCAKHPFLHSGSAAVSSCLI